MVFIHLGKAIAVARKTVTLFIDDLTGKEIAEKDVRHVEFSLDGVNYALDLSPASEAEFRKVFAPWVEKATRVSRPARRSAPRRDLDDVRVWARKNGFEVSDRGRVPKKVLDAYDSR